MFVLLVLTEKDNFRVFVSNTNWNRWRIRRIQVIFQTFFRLHFLRFYAEQKDAFLLKNLCPRVYIRSPRVSYFCTVAAQGSKLDKVFKISGDAIGVSDFVSGAARRKSLRSTGPTTRRPNTCAFVTFIYAGHTRRASLENIFLIGRSFGTSAGQCSLYIYIYYIHYEYIQSDFMTPVVSGRFRFWRAFLRSEA